jgi:hypothetical protein
MADEWLLLELGSACPALKKTSLFGRNLPIRKLVVVFQQDESVPVFHSGIDICSALNRQKKHHELPLFRKQWSTFKVWDIFLGDKGFCSYFDITKPVDRGVDNVVTLARRKLVSKRECLEELGPDDLLVKWGKPSYNKKIYYYREVWSVLPDRLVMRQIKVQVNQP